MMFLHAPLSCTRHRRTGEGPSLLVCLSSVRLSVWLAGGWLVAGCVALSSRATSGQEDDRVY